MQQVRVNEVLWLEDPKGSSKRPRKVKESWGAGRWWRDRHHGKEEAEESDLAQLFMNS